MNAVEIQRVQQRYGSMQVLHDLDLTLGEGEVLGLFGHCCFASSLVFSHLDFLYLPWIYDAAHPRAKRKQENKA